MENIENKTKKIQNRNSIKTKLLSAILVTSSAVTLVLTMIQLANDYRADLSWIGKRMEEIRISRVDTLSRALWQLDTNLIETGLQGLLAIQDVVYVEISDQPDEEVPVGEATYKQGKFDKDNTISFSEPLYHIVEDNEVTATLAAGQKIKLGTLNVVFSKQGIYHRLENKAILIMLTQAIKTFVVSFLIMIFIHNLITLHLTRMASYFEKFDINQPNPEPLKLERKRRKKKGNPDQSDEIDLMAGAFNKMADKVREQFETQKEYQRHLQALNESLDQRVQEQTAQIAEEKQQISILLNNMKQSVFRVNSALKIVGPISEYSSTLFRTRIEGQNLMELVFNMSDLPQMKKDTLRDSLVVSFGESSLQWDLTKENLPEKVKLPDLGITIRLSYTPLFNDADELEQLLCVVEDVTDIERLEEQRARNSRQISILQSLANSSEGDRILFFKTLQQQLANVSEGLQGELSEAKLVAIYRTLHTVKGNARMLRFEEIALLTHIFEATISKALNELKSDGRVTEETFKAAQSHYTDLYQECVDAANMGVKYFGVQLPLSTEKSSDHERSETVQILRRNFDHLKSVVSQFKGKFARPEFEDVELAVHGLLYRSLRDRFEKFSPMLEEIGARLGKEVQLNIEGEYVSLPPPILQAISDASVHIIRNSLDHGIETPKERLEAKKPTRGTISVSWKEGARGDLTILIKDDGRGIDTDKVLYKAWEMGLVKAGDRPTDHEIHQMIFHPKLSTAEKVTEISGRGVGMDAVGKVIEELGGNVQIHSVRGKGLEIYLHLPSCVQKKAEPTHQSAA